jgi:hypothetical protein
MLYYYKSKHMKQIQSNKIASVETTLISGKALESIEGKEKYPTKCFILCTT